MAWPTISYVGTARVFVVITIKEEFLNFRLYSLEIYATTELNNE